MGNDDQKPAVPGGSLKERLRAQQQAPAAPPSAQPTIAQPQVPSPQSAKEPAPADVAPAQTSVSQTPSPVAQVPEPEPAAPAPFAIRERTRYPEGESFDHKYEPYTTYVLRGQKELIKELTGKTGYSRAELAAIAYIMLLEDFGYDMKQYREQLPTYYRMKEMEERLKQLEEQSRSSKRQPPQKK
jgi:hypothetical protein